MLSSCSDDLNSKFTAQVSSFGKINEIVVVCDKNIWKGPMGDTLRYYFESAYPIMPKPEPMFDLRHFTAEDLNNEKMRRELRTYIFLCDLNDKDSPTTKMVKLDMGEEKFQKALSDPKFNSSVGIDKWAKEQLIIYIFGNGYDNLAHSIASNYEAVAKRVNKHDFLQLQSNTFASKTNDAGIEKQLFERFGLDAKIPGDFKIAKSDVIQNILWLRKDTKDATLNLVFRKFPYTSQEQFTKENIVAMRDEYGKQFISSEAEGSYMKTNVKDLPILEYSSEKNGNYMKEIRGIWEMENDFKGGPYFSYCIFNKVSNEIIFIDAFMYAPGIDKRNFMQQLELIVKNMKVANVN